MHRDTVEERVGGPWFIFGAKGDFVDVCNSDGDLFNNVPRPVADKLIQAHDKFLDELADILKDN